MTDPDDLARTIDARPADARMTLSPDVVHAALTAVTGSTTGPRHAVMLPPPSPDALAAAKWSPHTPATPDETLDEHDPLDDAEGT